MERQFEFDDLRYCKRAINAVLVALEEELNKCTFEYNFYGETMITYIKFTSCLNTTNITDKYTIDKYFEYLDGRIMYLRELLKEVQAELDKGKDKFDPNKLDNDIWRVWESVLEELE